MVIYQIFFIVLLSLSVGCQSSVPQVKKVKNKLKSFSIDSTYSASYDLKTFDKVFPLSQELLEISGLSVYDEDSFACVNDEKGNIYVLSAKDMSVEEKIDFGSKGDYEGIERVGNIVYIVKNNGNIHSYDVVNSIDLPTAKNGLNQSNDVEGLAYDASENSLLLACKGMPHLMSAITNKNTKGVYRFDLNTQTVSAEPIITFADSILTNFISSADFYQSISVKAKKKATSRVKKFSPSGIAVNPKDGLLYTLSSVGKSLVISDRQGNVKEVLLLDNDIHAQPEGICFAANGDMYISNEGKGLVAKIYKYAYKNN